MQPLFWIRVFFGWRSIHWRTPSPAVKSHGSKTRAKLICFLTAAAEALASAKKISVSFEKFAIIFFFWVFLHRPSSSTMAFHSGNSSSAAASSASTPQWYYYLQNDPRGLLPDGWYEYDYAINQTVEQLFQRHQAQTHGKRSRQLVPMTASSGYQYELDFQKMMQRNSVSRKERPIARTTNGLAPFQQQRQQRQTQTWQQQQSPQQQHHQSQQQQHHQSQQAASSHNGNNSVNNNRKRTAHITRHMWQNGEQLSYVAPEILHEVRMNEQKVFLDVQPPTASSVNNSGDRRKSYLHGNHEQECAICLEVLWNPSGKQERVVALYGCKHEFHYECIHQALQNSSIKCPLCSKPIQHDEDNRTAKGKCPSGTMSAATNPKLTCQGFPQGTLEINYTIPSGIQKNYHPQPGAHFHGASRLAYLPDNALGQQLLARMQYAFCHGLTFMVGTSLTTSQPDVVTWASIHHKTSLTGGTQRYGFPDESYFDRCNEELDALGVPDSTTCQRWIHNL